MKIRAVIIEDEADSLTVLKSMLKMVAPEIEIVGQAGEKESAILLIESEQPDIVFMDVDIVGGNAFSVLENLTSLDFMLIFTTGYGRFAVQAIKYSALDYLLKPIDPDDLKLAIDKAKANMDKEALKLKVENLLSIFQAKDQRLVLTTDEGIEFIEINDIAWLEADKAYTKIHFTDGNSGFYSKNLKYFEDLLDEENFFRCHHSCIVNLSQISKYLKEDGGVILMKNSVRVPLASRRKTEFLSALIKHQK